MEYAQCFNALALTFCVRNSQGLSRLCPYLATLTHPVVHKPLSSQGVFFDKPKIYKRYAHFHFLLGSCFTATGNRGDLSLPSSLSLAMNHNMSYRSAFLYVVRLISSAVLDCEDAGSQLSSRRQRGSPRVARRCWRRSRAGRSRGSERRGWPCWS